VSIMERFDVKAQFIIPAFNNAQDIDKTISSILNQTFEKDKIYLLIMDFGSTDGTYEKILSYSSEHVGVFRSNKTKNKNLMISEMAALLDYLSPIAEECFYAVVYPGDVLYPAFLKKTVASMIESSRRPYQVICETDLFGEKEEIISQESLFQEDCFIDGKNDMSEYVKRGYRHQVQCLSSRNFFKGSFRAYGEMNEQRWWNKCGRMNINKTSYYIKEPLACLKPVKYDDELEEILFRWESIILQIASYEVAYHEVFDNDYIEKGSKNLAQYALWRSFLLADTDTKMAEDCRLISAVIDSEIEKTEVYDITQRYLEKHGSKERVFLKQYYEAHGMS